jgi:hypothetical protein
MGVIPTTLDQLTAQVTNGQGQVAGPFLASGVFTISSSGDATTVSLP